MATCPQQVVRACRARGIWRTTRHTDKRAALHTATRPPDDQSGRRVAGKLNGEVARHARHPHEQEVIGERETGFLRKYRALGEDEHLRRGEGERRDPRHDDDEVHAARRPDVSLERVTDGDVAVDGGRHQHVRGGEHRHHLHVGDQLAEHVRTVETQRYLPRHLCHTRARNDQLP